MAQVFETLGATTGDSGGTALTAHATDATLWGDYVELSASTSVAWDGFFVSLYMQNVQAAHYLVEVATGATSSEVQVVEGYLVGGSNGEATHSNIYFPIPIASGTRISARLTTTANATIDILLVGIGTTQTKFLKEAGTPETLGDIPGGGATGKGTSVDPGTSANTKGVWVEFDASAADDVDYISLNLINTSTSTSGDHDWLFDIGTGVVDSEVVIVDNIPFTSGSGNDEFEPGAAGPFLVSIPSGTRIAIRCQASTTTSATRIIIVVAHTMKLAGGAFTPDLKAFRFYEDDAGEAASTALAAQDIDISPNVDSDVAVQLRIRVDETGAIAGAGTDDYQLQYDKNSGGFVNLTTTDTGTGIRAVLAGLTNDAVTTNRGTEGISDGSGSFVAGEQSSDGLIDDRQLTASNFTEHVYGVEFVSSNVANNDTFDFELSTPVGIVNTLTPRATMVKTGGAVPLFFDNLARGNQ